MKKFICLFIVMLSVNTPAQNLSAGANLLESFGSEVKYFERSSDLDQQCHAFQNYMDSLAVQYPKASFMQLEQIALKDPAAYSAQALAQDPACRSKETTLTEGACLVNKINPEQAVGITGECYTNKFYIKKSDGKIITASITKEGNNIVFLGWPINRYACKKLIEYVNEVLPSCE